MLGEILTAVKATLPKFNNEVIIDLRRKEIDNLPQFIADRYRECASVADPNLVFVDYKVMQPLDKLLYELNRPKKKNRINIKEDEAVIVEYVFRYFDNEFRVPLYIPYIYEDSCLIVGNTRYECLLNMSEKLFSVRAGSSGITIKLIRLPISFHKNTPFAYYDEYEHKQFVSSIVTCKIHYKKPSKSKKIKPTIIHYLLCKFTLQEILSMFDINKDELSFVRKEDPDPNHYYFKIKNAAIEPIFVKVNKNSMDNNRVFYDIVISILYTLSAFRFILYEDLINNSKEIFMIILGKIIHNTSTSNLHALNYMIKHIESVDTYLDEYNKHMFHYEGIMVNDIYDLLCFIQVNIGKIIIDYPNNNMYNKRIEAINNVIADGVVRMINRNIYKVEKKDNINHMFNTLSKAFSVHPKKILQSLGTSDSVRFSSSGVYSDNWLLSIGDKCVKRLSAATRTAFGNKAKKGHSSGINAYANKFHPSMLVVECPIGFSSKPGTNCLINPYVNINEMGGLLRRNNSEEIEELKKYINNDINNKQIIVDDQNDEEILDNLKGDKDDE